MSTDAHPHDFTLTGPNGSVRFSILGMGIFVTPRGGETDCLATRFAEALRDEWCASGQDAACVWARLGELYATLPAPEAPVEVAPVASDDLRTRVRAALVDGLGGQEAMHCTRAWEAWGYGTMSEDDFAQVVDDDAAVDELVDLIMRAIPTPVAPLGAED